MRPSLFAATAVLALVSALPAAAVPRYKLTELPGAAAPRVINNAGMIAGETSGSAGRLDNGAAPVALPTGYNRAYARGINSNGVFSLIFQGAAANDRAGVALAGNPVLYLDPLAGYAAAGAFGVGSGRAAGYSLASGSFGAAAANQAPNSQPAGTLQATLWTGTTATALVNPFGAGNSVASAINESNIVGGTVVKAPGQTRAVLWAADGTATVLGLQAGQSIARLRDLSEGGDALGQTLGALGTVATIWSQGSVYTLANLSGYSVGAGRGLNDLGQAVGFSTRDTDGSTLGMYWAFNGHGYDAYALDSLVVNLGGWQTGAAQSINDAGVIVGFGTRADGTQGAYMLSMVPEPAGWAMMIAGFGVIGASARRQRRMAA